MTNVRRRDGIRRRTINMPESRAQLVRTASRHLGISGERFIADAIREHACRVLGEIRLEELETTGA